MTERQTAASRAAFRGGSVIICDDLVRIFRSADVEVVALHGLDLLVDAGEMVAIVGASGSGKSTLLNILGGLDSPTAGRVRVANHDLATMSARTRMHFRRRVIGFVWQRASRNLIDYMTAVENIEMPMGLVGRRDARLRSGDLLDIVGLGDRGGHLPDQLSGGEQQRLAIAVALANEPPIILADEPTGQLDSDTATEVMDVLQAVNRDLGTTVVVVTHDPLVSERVARTVAIRDGRTSVETLRHLEATVDGTHEVRSEDYVVLDRVGRMQVPKRHVEALRMQRLVRVQLQRDHFSVWPTVQADRVLASASAPTPAPVARGGARSLGSLLRHDRAPKAGVIDAWAATSGAVGAPVMRSDGPAAPILVARGVHRTYETAAGSIHALRDVNLDVRAGELLAVKGRSGSGKTTLLNILGGLDRPSEGLVAIQGRDTGQLSEDELASLRRREVAFVFQSFGLLPFLTAAENVEIPMRLANTPAGERRERVRELLALVGLSQRAQHLPGELSGGEQQRVAIARALANGPSVLLADEPTGQLDLETGHHILALIRRLADWASIAAVIATHDPAMLDLADRVEEIHDGTLVPPAQS